MARQPKEDFARWAASYQGMYGGNLQADLWFCGIEYGGNDEMSSISFDDVPDKILNFNDKGIPYVKEATDGDGALKITGPYTKAQAKIARRYHTIASIDTLNKLAGENGLCFMMNLYPIAFRAHDDSLWTIEHYQKTGFVSKSEYKSWSLNNRFPRLKGLVTAHNPKVLICFGRSLAREFLAAFSDSDEQIFDNLVPIEIGSETDKSLRTIDCTRINGGKTLLMICPFPTNRFGLNSDKLLDEVGDTARRLQNERP